MVIHEILWESYCFISSQSLLTSEIMSMNINRLIYIIQGFSSYSHNCVKTLCQVLALVPPLYPQPCFMLLGSGLGKPHFPFALWLPVRIFAGFRLAKDHRVGPEQCFLTPAASATGRIWLAAFPRIAEPCSPSRSKIPVPAACAAPQRAQSQSLGSLL